MQSQSPPRGLFVNPPFRADQVGSFLRTPKLFKKRQEFEAKQCSREDLKLVEDEAVQQCVQLQREVGIKTITDGELRRGTFFEGVFENLSGNVYVERPISQFTPFIPRIETMDNADEQVAESFYCNGKIKRLRSFYVDQFKYTKSLVPPEEVKNIKITMCSPTWYHRRLGSKNTYDHSVYKNDDEYFDDIGAAYREEIRELYELGCRQITIDDPTFAYFCNPKMIAALEALEVDHEKLLDTYIRAVNVCTQGRPKDLMAGIHLCRGNFKGGRHFSEGPYDRVAPKLFNNMDVDAFFLEYDTERAGDFGALKHVPLNKSVVLGLVTTKNPKLESIDEVISRVHQAAEIMSTGNPDRTKEHALNQLCLSPQCGFASVWEGNPVTEDDERKKLGLIVEAAQRIWS